MSLRKTLLGSALAGACLLLGAPSQAEPSFSYHVTHVLPLPGEGNWDYLTFSASQRRLFASRVGGVDVLDASKPDLSVIGQIPGVPGALVNRAVLVEGRDFGFTSNGVGNSTTLFRLSDLAVYGVFPLGEPTDAAVYDNATGNAVFFSNAGQEALVYDLGEQEAVAHIPLGSAPEFAVDDGQGSIYVNLPDTGQVAEISVARRKVIRQFPVSDACKTNASIDIDREDHLLFVGCFSGVMDVIDSRSGKVVSTFPTGPLNDAVVYDAGLDVAFASSVDGKITAVKVHSPTRQSLLGVAITQPGARTMTVDPRTHRLFTDTATVGAPFPGITIPPVIPGTYRILTLAP